MEPSTKHLQDLIKEQAIQIKSLQREVNEVKLALYKLQTLIKRLQNP